MHALLHESNKHAYKNISATKHTHFSFSPPFLTSFTLASLLGCVCVCVQCTHILQSWISDGRYLGGAAHENGESVCNSSSCASLLQFSCVFAEFHRNFR